MSPTCLSSPMIHLLTAQYNITQCYLISCNHLAITLSTSVAIDQFSSAQSFPAHSLPVNQFCGNWSQTCFDFVYFRVSFQDIMSIMNYFGSFVSLLLYICVFRYCLQIPKGIDSLSAHAISTIFRWQLNLHKNIWVICLFTLFCCC